MKKISVIIAASAMLIASSACTPEGGDPQPTIRVPKNKDKPKNRDKQYRNKPKPRLTPPCSPGDERWVCPK